MKKIQLQFGFILFLTGFALALSGVDPVWSYQLTDQQLKVTVSIPENVYFYGKETFPTLKSDGKEIKPSVKPEMGVYDDPFSGKLPVMMGKKDFSWIFHPAGSWKFPLTLELVWQGCSKGSEEEPGTCFMPGKNSVILTGSKKMTESETLVFSKNNKDSDTFVPSDLLPDFEILRSGSGYIGAEEFVNFLQGNESKLFISFAGKSFFWILLLTFLGGIALNLTPCVLPMIPINLAIIGAGNGNSRWSCILKGLIYGSGIALAYGLVGAAAVLTGSSFGIIDSTWWFNALVAILFIVLGLSLFDLFLFDLSRFDTHSRSFSGARFAGVFLMGAVAALLAGACVAPVVVAALLQAGKMYNEGEKAGLFLPFILGLGMALPWPLAAGGFSVLPKPGVWMKYVKYIFGVIIIGMGIYYGFLSFQIALSSRNKTEAAVRDTQQLAEAIRQSSVTGKPVLIDFYADWCKNCKTMEMTTLKNPSVVTEMQKFIFIQFDATDISGRDVRKVLDRFGVTGLPAYLIIRGK